jgi:hypothetical protein
MATVFRSAKGGSGTTTVACAISLMLARTNPVILVDLGGGDVSAVLGLRESANGIEDWFASAAPGEALESLSVDHGKYLRVLTSDRPLIGASEQRWTMFGKWISTRPEVVVIDAGLDAWPDRVLDPSEHRHVFVTRPCYLSLRRSFHHQLSPRGLVVIREQGRSLTSADVEAVFTATIDAEIPFDPLIAQCVDAGLVLGRLPRSLSRPLRPLLAVAIDDQMRPRRVVGSVG